MEIYANFHKSYCLAIFERCEKLSLVLWNDLNNFLPYFELKNGITLISIERNLWDALQKIFYEEDILCTYWIDGRKLPNSRKNIVNWTKKEPKWYLSELNWQNEKDELRRRHVEDILAKSLLTVSCCIMQSFRHSIMLVAAVIKNYSRPKATMKKKIVKILKCIELFCMKIWEKFEKNFRKWDGGSQWTKIDENSN